MGAWGTGLYQDDVTCDIKEEYLNMLKIGMSNVEATENMIEIYEDYINDIDDGPLFWFALADIQWKYGRLLPKVKEKAIEYIECGIDLQKWKVSPKQYQKRKKVLDDLKIKLESPLPPEKKITKLKFTRAVWNVGDVLIHQITDERLKDNKWYNKYVLFRVIGIHTTNVGSLPKEYYYDEQDVLAMYNWVGNKIINKERINQLKFCVVKNVFGDEIPDINILNPNTNKNTNFQIILQDNKYKNKLDYNQNGIGWVHERNIDFSIVSSLKKSEENSELIDETKEC